MLEINNVTTIGGKVMKLSKNYRNKGLLVFLAILFVVPTFSNGNEVIIEPGHPDSVSQHLNLIIMGDTLANGERRDPEAIYVLRRESIYWSADYFRNDGFFLHLKSEDTEGPLPIVRQLPRLGSEKWDNGFVHGMEDFLVQSLPSGTE